MEEPNVIKTEEKSRQKKRKDALIAGFLIAILVLASVAAAVHEWKSWNTPIGRYYEWSEYTGGLTENYIEFKNGELYAGKETEEGDEKYYIGDYEFKHGTIKVTTVEGEIHIGYFEKEDLHVEFDGSEYCSEG